jgi:hypothetical protein
MRCQMHASIRVRRPLLRESGRAAPASAKICHTICSACLLLRARCDRAAVAQQTLTRTTVDRLAALVATLLPAKLDCAAIRQSEQPAHTHAAW